jgi:hypothetical protein
VKTLLACSLLLLASTAHALGWSIAGDGVSLMMSGGLSQDEYPSSTGPGWKTDITFLTDYSVGESGKNPVCYMLGEWEKNRVLFCEKRKNWRLSGAVFYSEKADKFKCVRNCAKGTPRVLRMVSDEGD